MAEILFSSKQEIGRLEILHDNVSRRIPKDSWDDLTEFAWSKGERTAVYIKQKNPDLKTAEEYAIAAGASVTVSETGPQLIYSEYYSRRREIRLIKEAIENTFIPQNKANLSTVDFDHVKNIFIAHELFHHLECTDESVGLTFKEREVTIIDFKVFQWKSGLRCLSEIAAHSFVKELLGFDNRY